MGGDGQYHHHHAVLGQALAVPHDHGAHVTHAGAVHVHLAGGHGAVELEGLGRQLDDGAVVGNGDVVALHAHVLSQLAVDLEHALLAVEGNEEAGLGEGVDDLQLLLAGVAGHMQDVRPVIDHLHALAEQLVDDAGDGHLVAGNGGGGEDHLVPCAQLHLLVGGEGHTV